MSDVNIPTANLFGALTKKAKKPAGEKKAPKEIRVVTPAVPETKQEREVKDHHQDRSNKGARERKGGAGRGGWEETPNKTKEEAQAIADEAKAPPKVHHQAAEDQQEEKTEQQQQQQQQSPAGEEKKQPEPVQLTMDEYLEQKKQQAAKPIQKLAHKARKVDETAFKNMAKFARDEETFVVNLPAAEKPQPPKKDNKAAEKKPEKKVLKTYFRMERPERAGGRGRGGYRGGDRPAGGESAENKPTTEGGENNNTAAAGAAAGTETANNGNGENTNNNRDNRDNRDNRERGEYRGEYRGEGRGRGGRGGRGGDRGGDRGGRRGGRGGRGGYNRNESGDTNAEKQQQVVALTDADFPSLGSGKPTTA
jgi:hypothetical protein